MLTRPLTATFSSVVKKEIQRYLSVVIITLRILKRTRCQQIAASLLIFQNYGLAAFFTRALRGGGQRAPHHGIRAIMWPHGPGSGLTAEEFSSTGTDTFPNKV